MKIMGQIAKVPATLNDDLPKCKITSAPPPTSPPTTQTTTVPEICKGQTEFDGILKTSLGWPHQANMFNM